MESRETGAVPVTPGYLVYGQEVYWHERFMKAVSSEFGGEKEVLAGDETSWKDLKDVLGQLSFFGPKLWVVRSAQFLFDGNKEVTPPELSAAGNCLILSCPLKDNPAPRGFMTRWHKMGCTTLEAAVPSFSEASGWVRNKLTAEGLGISNDALNSLILTVGRSLGRLQQEVEKIRLYMKSEAASGKGGAAGLVTEDVVSACSSEDPEKTAFAFVDAVATKNTPLALSEFWDLRARGANPIMLLSMIASHLGLMWRSKESSEKGIPQSALGKVLGVHPYPARKALQQSGRWTYGQLEAAMRLLCDVDELMKTGRMDPEKGVEYALTFLGRK